MNPLWWNALNDNTSIPTLSSSPPPPKHLTQRFLDSSPVPHSQSALKRARTSAPKPVIPKTSKNKSADSSSFKAEITIDSAENSEISELVRDLHGSAQTLRKEALRVVREFDGRCEKFQDVVEKWVHRDAELKEEGLRGQEDLMEVVKVSFCFVNSNLIDSSLGMIFFLGEC